MQAFQLLFKRFFEIPAQPVVCCVGFQLAATICKPQSACSGNFIFKRVVNECGQDVVMFAEPSDVLACVIIDTVRIGDQANQAIVPGQCADLFQHRVQLTRV